MFPYHVLDNVIASCALGDACWVEGHYATAEAAEQSREQQPNWNPRSRQTVNA